METEDEWLRRFSELLGVVAAVFIVMGLVLGSVNFYRDKSRMVEFYNVFTDLKVFFHEYYGFYQRSPTETEFYDHIREMDYDKRLVYLSIRDYGLEAGVFWFELAFLQRESAVGVVTVQPDIQKKGGSVVWRCGYATQTSNGQQHPDAPRTTVNPDILANICKQ